MLDAAKPTSRGNGIARTKSEVRASPSYRRCSRERQPIWLRRKLPGWSRRWETVGRRRCLPSGGGRSCCRFMVQATGWQPDWQLNAVFYDGPAIKQLFGDKAFIDWRDNYGPQRVMLVPGIAVLQPAGRRYPFAQRRGFTCRWSGPGYKPIATTQSIISGAPPVPDPEVLR
jgi:hypothetical protein